MPRVQVDLADRAYEVIVENGLLKNTQHFISNAGLNGRKIAIISDETVAGFHVKALQQSLGDTAATLHTVPAGEASKSLAHVQAISSEMIQAGHDRRSLVIALGGGVVGDLAGFIASIFYRGVPFIQIPTTIVSQVDSSVGGKTGVNTPEGKNLIGAFHQPKLVLIDPETLRTLPAREFYEGFAEAIKHAAIRDASMLDELLQLDPESRDVPADLLSRNIEIKARLVESDEYETKDIRALLNFGHTIGHGIEASLPYGELLHGEAISLGMRAALFLSEKRSELPAEQSEKVISVLRHFHLPLVLPREISTETVIEKMKRDKKFKTGKIRFVTLSKNGKAHVVESVTLNDLKEATDFLRS